MLNQKKLAKKEQELYEYDGEDKIISSLELVEILKETDDSVFQFNTGISSMDRILENVEAGELITVTAPTGHGKTTLLMTITQNMARNNTLAVWFSLEVTPRQFIKKLLKGSEDGKVPLFYIPANNIENNTKWLIDKIIEAKVKYDVSVVFIDHLHQIFAIDRFNGKNMSLEIGDVVAKIKQIAIEYNLVIFLIAHSTDDKTHVTREPKMMDIRDSGMITRLSDTVIGIWRIRNDNSGEKKKMEEIQEEDTRAKVRIWKNRREGTLGYWIMNHRNGLLVELDNQRLEEEIIQKEQDDIEF